MDKNNTIFIRSHIIIIIIGIIIIILIAISSQLRSTAAQRPLPFTSNRSLPALLEFSVYSEFLYFIPQSC